MSKGKEKDEGERVHCGVSLLALGGDIGGRRGRDIITLETTKRGVAHYSI